MKKEFARYVTLNVLGMLGVSCYILADTFFIARWLGLTGLAALNLAIPAYSLIVGTGLMLGMGGGARYAVYKATGEPEMGCRSFTHTLRMGGIAGACFMLCGGVFSRPIAVCFGADASTLPMTEVYLRVLLLSAPCFLCNYIVQCFVRNDGAPGLVMAAMLTGSFSNILLDWMFMYLLRWGMFGAVFATCLSPLISLAVMSPFFLQKRHHFRIVRTPLEPGVCLHMLAVGGPAFIGELSNAVVILTFNTLMLRFAGNTGVAAYGVIANIALVVTSMYNGIAQGIQPLVSRNAGKGAPTGMLLRWAVLTIAVLFAGCYAGLCCGASPVAALFNKENDLELQRLAVQGIRLYFLGAGVAGCNIAAAVYLSCIGRTGVSNVVSLLRGLLVILPACLLLAQLWGVTGLWLSYPVTEVITGVVVIAALCFPKKFQKSL